MPQRTYLFSSNRKEKYLLNGFVQSQSLPRDENLRQAFSNHMIYQPDNLPPGVDMRPGMTRVEHQENTCSCVANSLAGAYEYLLKKANGRDTDVSRLFIYYNARAKLQNSPNVVDVGCTITSAIEALKEHGTCLEFIWEYNAYLLNRRPHDRAYSQAREYGIGGAFQLNPDLHEMKSCLAQGFPFAFGLKIYASFDNAARAGIVPTPNVFAGAREQSGGHAMLAVGYSDQSKAFIVRNSWGDQWGYQGYCFLSYDYLTDPSLCSDIWAISQLATNDLGQVYWDRSDSYNYLQGETLYGSSSSDDDDGTPVIETVDEDDEAGTMSDNQSPADEEKSSFADTTSQHGTDSDSDTNDDCPDTQQPQASPSNDSFTSDDQDRENGDTDDLDAGDSSSNQFANDDHDSPPNQFDSTSMFEAQNNGSNYDCTPDDNSFDD